MQEILNICHTRGLQVAQLNIDNEFDCIREDIILECLTIATVGKHMANVERSIDTIK